MAQEPVRILISVYNGTADVYTFGVPVDALIIDYDCGDATNTQMVPQSTGEPEEAIVQIVTATRLEPERIEVLQGVWVEAKL